MIFNNVEVGYGFAYFSSNVSAENIIDRSCYWDNSLGSSLDYVKDSDEIKDEFGNHLDTNLNDFEQAVYQVTDYSKPEIREVCKEDWETKKIVCEDETYYPYTKNETGRMISVTVGKHEQNIYDLIEENNLLKDLIANLTQRIEVLEKK